MPEELDRRRILVVDDEERMVRFIRLNLEHDGFQVSEAFNGKQAVQRLRDVNPDLILLDVMMPDLDGFEVLEMVREISNVPVIMLTAKGEEDDRVRGLEKGADDYVTKPFSPRELVARVKSAVRRMQMKSDVDADVPVLSFTRIRIDTGARTVHVNQQPVELTAIEFDLLQALAENRGRVLSREKLLEKVWGGEYFGEIRVVDVHLGHLRQKLGEEKLITTVRGVGYRFEDELL